MAQQQRRRPPLLPATAPRHTSSTRSTRQARPLPIRSALWPPLNSACIVSSSSKCTITPLLSTRPSSRTTLPPGGRRPQLPAPPPFRTIPTVIRARPRPAFRSARRPSRPLPPLPTISSSSMRLQPLSPDSVRLCFCRRRPPPSRLPQTYCLTPLRRPPLHRPPPLPLRRLHRRPQSTRATYPLRRRSPRVSTASSTRT